MAVRWGPKLVMLYNDGYREILGDKHPAALGRPLREIWAEMAALGRAVRNAIDSSKVTRTVHAS
jgi:hypothetical protein